MKKLKLRTLFSGIGSPESALKRLGIDYELVDFCEWDKYAEKSYRAIHQTDVKNWGDITKVDEKELEYADLLVYGSPCQDFSVAGENKGSVWTCRDCGLEYNPILVHWRDRHKCPKCESQNLEKTRSSLLVEGLRVVRETMPKYVVYENVKNIIGKKHRPTFMAFINEMVDYGYRNFYEVINAKETGYPEPVPQNRERVIVVSIRRGSAWEYRFPQKQELKIRLKDVLETEVDEKYYLKDKALQYMNREVSDGRTHWDFGYIQDGNKETAQCLTANMHKGVPYNVLLEPTICASIGVCNQRNGFNEKEVSSTIEASYWHGLGGNQDRVAVKEATKQGYTIATVGDSINLTCPDSETRRGRVGHEVANTLDTRCNQATLTESYRIRRLTPKECFRLMGFSDEEFSRAKAVNSDSQLYKQAGNSIVVNCMAAILRNLLMPETANYRIVTNWNDVPLIQAGKLDINHDQNSRVYNVNGVAPCLQNMQGGIGSQK